MTDENSDGIITADELGGFIKSRVMVDVDGAHTPQRGRIGSEMGEFVFISETLGAEIDEAFPRDVQIEAMSSKVAKLEKELKKKDQENRMKKVIGNQYVNIDFTLGKPRGVTIVGSLSSSVMDYETVTPPISEEMQDLMDSDLGDMFGDLFGTDGLPEAQRITGPSLLSTEIDGTVILCASGNPSVPNKSPNMSPKSLSIKSCISSEMGGVTVS
jgi:hypothetical protein